MTAVSETTTTNERCVCGHHRSAHFGDKQCWCTIDGTRDDRACPCQEFAASAARPRAGEART